MRDWDKCHKRNGPMLIKKGGVHFPGQFVFYNLRTTSATLIKLFLSEANAESISKAVRIYR